MIAITLQSPGEIFFSLGPITLYWYGFIIATAFLIGLAVVLNVAKLQGIDQERVINLSVILLIGGIICARLYYVIFNWDYFSRHLLESFMTWHGGLSIHGVIIGCFFILLVYTKIHKLNFFQYTDLFTYGLVIGQSIGRWGNFFNSEAYGGLTNFPIRVYIPDYGYCHPTFLYESVWNLIVFFVLYFVIKNYYINRYGIVTFCYLTLYSIGRFFIEGLRIDNIYSVLGLHLAQFVSLALFFAGLLALYVLIFKKPRRAQR